MTTEIVRHNDLKIAKDEDSTPNIINEPVQKSETFYSIAQDGPQLTQRESNIDAEEDIYMNEGLNDIVSTLQEEPQLLQKESDTEEDIYMNEGLNEIVSSALVSGASLHEQLTSPKGIIGKEKNIFIDSRSTNSKPLHCHSASVVDLNPDMNTGDKHPQASKSASSLEFLKQGNSDKAEIYTYASPHPDWALGKNRKTLTVEDPIEESIYY